MLVGDVGAAVDTTGASVGVAVGTLVGESVGFDVGDAVGDAVGLAVGTPVGAPVGEAVGIAVGAWLFARSVTIAIRVTTTRNEPALVPTRAGRISRRRTRLLTCTLSLLSWRRPQRTHFQRRSSYTDNDDSEDDDVRLL